MEMTAGVGKYNCEKRMALGLEIFNLKSIIFTEEGNIFVKTKLICFKINNKLQFC